MARLIVVSGAPDGGDRTVELTGDSVSIGRDAANAIPLDKEGKASRRHCQVTPVSGGSYEVSDLKSTNGTRVNGEAVERRRLRPGDVIEVGLTRIRFEDDAAAAAQAATGDACYLEWTSGDRKGDRVALTAARTTFGRRDTNTVPLEDKMASGHHAEITKDLNGFTVRDLGSTNGTLVNGEPITEVLLKHGDRVRVGNARFAFKDPSMKDLEISDAGADDEAGDWGMMGDVDTTARAKGGGRGLAAAGLMIAALGGAAFYASGRESTGPGGTLDLANQIVDGTFDSPDLLLWAADDGAPLSVDRSTSGGAPKGGPHLVVRRTDSGGAGVAIASYAEELDTKDNGAYRVSARMSRDGSGPAALAVQWSRLGNVRSGSTAVSQTVRVGAPERTGSWSPVERIVRRPAWAKSGRLVLIVGPDASARLDDVRFEVASSAAAVAGRLDGEKGIDVLPSAIGGLDLIRNSTVLAVALTPWARFADGRIVGGPASFVVDGAPTSGEGSIEFKGRLVDDKGAVPASIRWSKVPEGLMASISVDGAEAIGLSADFPRAHLSDQLKVRSGAGSKVVEPTGGIDLDGATRVLVGDAERRADVNRPETLLALDLSSNAKPGRLSTYSADDSGLLRVALWTAGATGEIRVVMNFDGERQRAVQALREAKTLVDRSPGPGIKRLDAVADEFPFEAEIRAQALAAARAREDRAKKDMQGLQQALMLFSVYRDRPSLDDVTRRASELDAQFPAAEGAIGGQEATIRNDIAKAKDAKLQHEIASAGPEVKRLTRLAKLLEQEKGFEVMAAIYYDAVVHRFGDLEAAPNSPLTEQIADCRKSLAALLEIPSVRESFPKLGN